MTPWKIAEQKSKRKHTLDKASCWFNIYIYTYIHIQLYIYIYFDGHMKAYIIWLQSFSMSPDICDASCIPKRVQYSARDLSEALAWHLQSCRKARQLAIAMTGSRFLEHPEIQLYVDVSQRKYSCKPSGKLRLRPWYYNPFWMVSLGFQALALPGYSRVVMLIYWRIRRSKNPIWMWKGCPGHQMKSWKVCSSQAASQPMHTTADAICSQSSGCSEKAMDTKSWVQRGKHHKKSWAQVFLHSYTHPIWFRMLDAEGWYGARGLCIEKTGVAVIPPPSPFSVWTPIGCWIPHGTQFLW